MKNDVDPLLSLTRVKLGPCLTELLFVFGILSPAAGTSSFMSLGAPIPEKF